MWGQGRSLKSKEVELKKILAVVALAAALLVRPSVGSGSGFLIYEHGAAAMAMGGAFISIANDPTAIWHNPAGIAFLKGTHVSVGTTLIRPSGSMTLTQWPYPSPAKTWEQKSQTFYPSTFYITQSVGEKVTLGFGFCSPYGLGASWPKENQLRYLGYEDDMKTFFFNPTVGIKITDQLSIGAGVSYIYSTVKFKLVRLADFSAFGMGAYDVPAELKGNGNSWGFNAGLLYRAEKFSLGFNWRSSFNIKYSGDVALDVSGVPAPLRPYVPTTAGGETTFKFPNILGIGASVKPIDQLLLSLDLHYVLWSRYDKYVVTFDDPRLEEMAMEEKWKDSILVRLGGQYTFTPKFCLRAGFIYDQTPQPVESMDPLLPDADRYALTAGIGWTLAKNVVLDLTFHHEMFGDRTSPNRNIYKFGPVNFGESTYEMTANLLGISLSFGF
jgi:long-chain fatty acid transport protein